MPAPLATSAQLSPCRLGTRSESVPVLKRVVVAVAISTSSVELFLPLLLSYRPTEPDNGVVAADGTPKLARDDPEARWSRTSNRSMGMDAAMMVTADSAVP